MPLYKFSILALSLLFSISSWAFDDNACLQNSFDVVVSHKAPPLGLSKNVLTIKKDGCVLNIEHTKWYFMKKAWLIDVCREPVHIKRNSTSVEVLKRAYACSSEDQSDFCKDYYLMRELLQDDGLIFAEGEKENLNSDHGKVYCAYVLLDAHLQKGMVLSRDQVYEGVIVPLTGKMSAPSSSSTTEKEEVIEDSARPLEPTKNDPSTGTF
ncbi:MAG: hypothetical protein COW00_13935 [Bdellovibrio sp. CG12_big_fil_rev_8_21_14_0_65_39_13]|nr:MAG: hypothetical protein COW78_07360 [Bdellovibrio sp. CG22_combo_CG10-13_8_21_14_all_39_27]PIQ58714.1 MAG: hypothetical protein COW00_13935 [Bdellovibrio sp. CG12_big_fil_rev_8_21_14_0_65_39_13]PIR33089.1 MAG: hypothetical protein COV37_18530 [Bdellovibrio sp. CG11_big_fil_rev_8_21_14_0_20_39_38]PJB53040.1 MAG: hypothetical protein CO099_09245 [Bdellovibrio sp. CG_4_9_14_3_um_filter_39_7]